jgi:hypothetical protein
MGSVEVDRDRLAGFLDRISELDREEARLAGEVRELRAARWAAAGGAVRIVRDLEAVCVASPGAGAQKMRDVMCGREAEAARACGIWAAR